MQKVVGSSPISRFEEALQIAGCFRSRGLTKCQQDLSPLVPRGRGQEAGDTSLIFRGRALSPPVWPASGIFHICLGCLAAL